MSSNPKSLDPLKIAFLILGMTVLTSCGSDSGSSQSASAQGAATSAQGGQSGGSQTIDVAKVVSQKLSLTVRLPGEITPYESVAEFPKVNAFVKWIGVDRGSHVKEGQEIVRLKAPFDGVVTERNVHPGALVGPSGNVPMLRIEKVSRLRVVLPVPENYVSGTVNGAKVTFTVPAFPGEKFTGTIARIPDSLDVKTRTMPVELDVTNSSG